MIKCECGGEITKFRKLLGIDHPEQEKESYLKELMSYHCNKCGEKKYNYDDYPDKQKSVLEEWLG